MCCITFYMNFNNHNYSSLLKNAITEIRIDLVTLIITLEFLQPSDNRFSKTCWSSLSKANMIWEKDNLLLAILEAIDFEIVFG